MSTSIKANWARLIRQYVLQLISLYLILGTIAISYNALQRITSDQLRQIANDYHLKSNNHLLKAIDEIRLIEYQLSFHLAESEPERARLPESLQPDQPLNLSSSMYVLDSQIEQVLELHRQYPDILFDGMVLRIEQQLANLQRAVTRFSANPQFAPDLIRGLTGLHTPLSQLERLHEIQRDNQLTRLSEREQRDSLIFILLVCIALLAGVISTWRMMKAINMVIADQLQAEQRIRVFSQVIEQIPVSVVLTDTDASPIYVNKNFESASGYQSDEILGKKSGLIQSCYTPPTTYREILETLADGRTWKGELHNLKKNGDPYVEDAHFAPVFSDDGAIEHYMVIKEDITLKKMQEEKILRQAHYDNLTDLPNRFLALDRLSQHLSEAERKQEKVALLFLDLDDFKKVNDTLGHDTGDKLLIEAAERLIHVVRHGDTVARLGGDEFIILLSGLHSAADVLPVADSLVEQFRRSFSIDGREMILTASVGIAIYPDDGDNASDLLRNADSAMYSAKEHGRNVFSFFTEDMNQKVSRRLALEEQMHGALERGEFNIVYQPQIDLSDERIIGAEALLRWDNPVLEQVLPDEFIPIAEQTGLIVTIGEYVIEQALAQAVTWNQLNPSDFTIAINLSPRQFRDPNLVQFITETIDRSGLPADCLELEITEGVLMSGHAYIDEAINRLSKLGVELAMDDFGTGYSSLSYLQTYPFNTLKIDRGFVSDITEDTADRELVNATIAMAHGLGLKVVAEGVETLGQLQHLKTKGCEFAQGNYFSPPISADQLTSLLQDQAANRARLDR
ncbi:MAG: EAL domain-containing protein [Gammaproteobacteria bacterium]|nr:EAL domain-containing protein [Gammaproteobacteria bacterium]